MSILAQTFFTLVSRHLVSLVFLSVGHFITTIRLFYTLFNVVDESLGGLEGRNIVCGDDNGGVLGDVTTSLLSTFLDDETTKATEIDVLTLGERLLDNIHEFFDGGLDGDLLDTGFLCNLCNDFCLCHTVFFFEINYSVNSVPFHRNGLQNY